MKRSIFIFSLLFIFYIITSCKKGPDLSVPREMDLAKAWKFKQGDNPDWKSPDFDASDWQEIEVNRIWEKKGFPDYDGYAWYRTTIKIPSALKRNAYLKDSIQFHIGKVDDTEQTFLNGFLIGQNGKTIPYAKRNDIGDFTGDPEAYRYDRLYTLSVKDKRIKWDKENVIAVRVHDHGGGGGLYESSPSVSMKDIKDVLKIDIVSSPYNLKESPVISKPVTLKNRSNNISLDGIFFIEVIKSKNEDVVFTQEEEIILKPGETAEISFTSEIDISDMHIVRYSFQQKGAVRDINVSQEIPYILTPIAPAKPRINGPDLFAARPGAPFMYRIPATGDRPMTFSVEALPENLTLDIEKGIITGSVNTEGTYEVIFKAENSKGIDEKDFQIIIGDTICLTPPMGWNSWNCWGLSVSADKVKETADYMVSSGLADHGWMYINIDDGWEAEERTSEGELLGNDKFPDFKELADYVHSKGLKLGIYSSPGPKTCGGYPGSYQHEYQDAQTWARWGIDYLKYDWCAYEQIAKDHSLEELQKPYILMDKALKSIDRDIVYSLCQYGWGDVWKWGEEVGGNLWRTTGDIVDTWASLHDIGFSQDKCSPYAGPGHWNDPDMLIVGWVGWGPQLHPTRLTVNEQYTHISLWSLLAAPLLLGCDLSKLDDFTLNLLTNDEVLAVNQDPLGDQAVQLILRDEDQVWKKDLADGSMAVGLFNLAEEPKEVEVTWNHLELDGTYTVRDLWRQENIGQFDEKFSATVQSHGVVMIRISQ